MSSKGKGQGTRWTSIDANVRSSFALALPRVVQYRRAALHRLWVLRPISRLVLIAISLYGLSNLGWDPLMTLLMIAGSLWISLLAELVAMYRLHRLGVRYFASFEAINAFVCQVAHALAKTLETPALPGTPAQAELVARSSIPTSAEHAILESVKNRSRAIANVLLVAAVMSVLAMLAPREQALMPMLLAQRWAWLLFLSSATLQILHELRTVAAPKRSSDRLDWVVERGRLAIAVSAMAVILVHFLIIAAFSSESARTARAALVDLYYLIGAWSLLDLMLFNPFRWRDTRKLQALGRQMAVPSTLLSESVPNQGKPLIPGACDLALGSRGPERAPAPLEASTPVLIAAFPRRSAGEGE